MDLSVSPDVEAYFCYVIVIVLGAITAVVQINRGLGDLAGIWLIPGTWLLFLMYLSVPIGLFWFLDRSGAITDTSLFAAALIGVGYERIMNGTNQTIASAANLLTFWTPFQSYANEVQKSVLERTRLNEGRLIDGLVSSVHADNTRYQLLENMAINASSDAPALRAKLKDLEDAVAPAATVAPPVSAATSPAAAAVAAAAAAGAAAAAAAQQRQLLEDKTRLLFTELVKVPDAFYRMRSRNIITKGVYWLDVKGWRRSFYVLLVIIPVATVVGLFWSLVIPDLNSIRSSYYVWRLVKTNASSIEQNRARSNLLTVMNPKDSPIRDSATRNMAQALRQPGLPVERIDLLLQTLLESRETGNLDLPKQLVTALRSTSVDARTRINDVLKHLADTSCQPKFSEDKDKVWKPSDGDATVSLEIHIAAWTNYWNNVCNKKPTSAESNKTPTPAARKKS